MTPAATRRARRLKRKRAAQRRYHAPRTPPKPRTYPVAPAPIPEPPRGPLAMLDGLVRLATMGLPIMVPPGLGLNANAPRLCIHGRALGALCPHCAGVATGGNEP